MSEMPETYSTVAKSVQVKIPVGLCRFYASVREVTDEEQAKEFLAQICAQFADATHNAWAYKLGHGDQALVRYSDDGEPANTAGPPMLQAIEGNGLTNVIVVGTRYFGGVKLGIGGLIRAYRDCALAGLQEAGVRTETIKVTVVVSNLDYAVLGDVLRELESCRSDIIAIDYQLQVSVRAAVRPRDLPALETRIRDITRGQGHLKVQTDSC